jgi:ribonuclease HI
MLAGTAKQDLELHRWANQRAILAGVAAKPGWAVVTRPLLEVYCDGSGEERVGRPGGWAFVIVRDGEVRCERDGGAIKTTSLVMELEAARSALEEIVAQRWHFTHHIMLISDCRVVLEVAAGTFTPRPEQYAVRSSALRALALTSGAVTKWVRAHAGHQWNEHVDASARSARLRMAARARQRRTT